MGLRGKFRSATAKPAKVDLAPNREHTVADQKTSKSPTPQITDDKIVLPENAPEDAPVIGTAVVTKIPHHDAEKAAEVIEQTHNGNEKEKSRGIVESADSHSTPASIVNVINSDENIGNGDTTEEVQDESQYPGGLSLSLLTFGLCMAIFTVALDNT